MKRFGIVLVLLALITFGCDKPTEPEPTTGTLIVESYPKGATVWMDGKEYGDTPDTLYGVSAGNHEIHLELTGYNPTTGTAYVTAGEINHYYKNMSIGRGTIYVTCTPADSRVFVDNKLESDSTPVYIENVPSGPHVMKLTRDGYADWTHDVVVGVSDTIEVSAILDSLLGRLVVTSNPTKAVVRIHPMQREGETPFSDSLPPGKYEIQVEKPGYDVATRTVDVKAFETDSIHVELLLSTGDLNVTSSPQGALILVDGLGTGKLTPSIISVIPGSRKIRLQKLGYYDWDTTVVVIEDQTVEVSAVLEAKHTTLRITSSPSNAAILINGTYTGHKTPHNFDDITPGNYRIRVELSGHYAVDSLVMVELGTDNRLDLFLPVAPKMEFAFTVGDTIFLSGMDGILKDTIAYDYNHWIDSYIDYPGAIRWSPDGSYLAYTGDKYFVSIIMENGIWLVGYGGNRSMDFAWSPSSDELMWGYYCGGLYRYVISKHIYERVTSKCYDHSPAYNPSGTKVIFMLNNYGTRAWISTVNPNGSGRKDVTGRFTTGFDEDVHTEWTSDTTAIFKIAGNGIFEVRMSDGANYFTEKIDTKVSFYRMSRDRDWIAYVTSDGLYMVQVDIWSPWWLVKLSIYDIAVVDGGDGVLCRTSDGVYWVDRNGNDYHIINYPAAGRGAIDLKP